MNRNIPLLYGARLIRLTHYTAVFTRMNDQQRGICTYSRTVLLHN